MPHTVAGRPAVVTYDPAFLLRSQDAKAATWADLCRALALVRKAKAAHPTRAEPPGLQRGATSPCNGSLNPADDAAVCANASDHRTIAGLRCTALATPTQPALLKQALVCSQSGHGYCQLPD